eukprot:TRINITY_DN28989_c0_g1_i1.p1 TRINITY_DN28989_c0_g1~~TRINITY_DN28989_c0_g1_i1.p1  ORF type:complete len:1163 (-),score=281.33 TRINITY_DN28989_c0_g1_i1:40-3024(-)
MEVALADGWICRTRRLPKLSDMERALAHADLEEVAATGSEEQQMQAFECRDLRRSAGEAPVDRGAAYARDPCENLWRCSLACSQGEGTVHGFGRSARESRQSAMLRLLRRRGRWFDQADAKAGPQLALLRRLAKMTSEPGQAALGSRALLFADPHAASTTLLEALAGPPPCIAVCWDLLAKCWPHVLAASSGEDYTDLWNTTLGRVVNVARELRGAPAFEVWVRLAEAAAWSVRLPALEVTQRFLRQEVSATERYARYHLYNLYLERRAELKQELSVRGSGGKDVLLTKITWEIVGEGWRCTFESDTHVMPGDALQLEGFAPSPSNEGAVQPVLLEVLQDSRALLRALPDAAATGAVLELREARAKTLGLHQVVFRRQLTALTSLLQDADKAPQNFLAIVDRPSVSHAAAASNGARDDHHDGQRSDGGRSRSPESVSDAEGSCDEMGEALLPVANGGSTLTSAGLDNTVFDPSLREVIVDTWDFSGPAASKSAASAAANSRAVAKAGADGAVGGGLPTEAEAMREPTSAGRIFGLTASQQDALLDAFSRRLTLVRGPPGTGKTEVAAAIAALASQRLRSSVGAACARGPSRPRVLAACQSHAAAANLLERLEAYGIRAARVGMTLVPQEVARQRIFGELCCGEAENDKNFLIVDEAVATGVCSSRGQGKPPELHVAMVAAQRSMACAADVLIMTCASAGNNSLLWGFGPFPFLLVDEAAQCVEPAVLVPLALGCRQLTLVGDEKQLPATVLDRSAQKRGLNTSLFERMVGNGVVSEALGGGLVQLNEQRRMHPSIAVFPSMHFYDARLVNAGAALNRELLPGFPWPVVERSPGDRKIAHVAFVDSSVGAEEGTREMRAESGSLENVREAELLVRVLRNFVAAGVPSSSIAVITGYSRQREVLLSKLRSLGGVKVDTVDGFQGMERPLVLVSTVRAGQEIGFMRDRRRVNVLLTRAQQGLVVFGCRSTLEMEGEVWSPWLNFMDQRGLEVHPSQL